MQNEHYLDHADLTAELIKTSTENSKWDELTCLVPKDDEGVSAMLREHGFRYVGKRLVEGRVMTVFKWYRGLGKYEDMASFFDRRVRDYDLHMRDGNDAHESTFIALFEGVPVTGGDLRVLDLGCGTGAELAYLFQKAPNARVTAIDISQGMLERLRDQYREFAKNIETVCSSYLSIDFGEKQYDYAVACTTLHHLLAEDKLALYGRVRRALKDGGYLLISDYYADTAAEEESSKREYLELVDSGAVRGNVPYHIDLTLTFEHEVKLLRDAGFTIARAARTGGPGGLIAARA